MAKISKNIMVDAKIIFIKSFTRDLNNIIENWKVINVLSCHNYFHFIQQEYVFCII